MDYLLDRTDRKNLNLLLGLLVTFDWTVTTATDRVKTVLSFVGLESSVMSGKDEKQKSEAGMGVRRTASTDSTASVSSVTAGRFTSPRPDSSGQEVAFITSFGRDLSNMVCGFVWCPKHKKVLLSPLGDPKGLFFPSAPVKFGQAWYEAVVNCLKDALTVEKPTAGKKPYLSFSSPRLCHDLLLQVPVYLEFVERKIYSTELTHDQKHAVDCCQDSTRGQWLTVDEIRNKREVWGPEPLIFASAQAETGSTQRIEIGVEYTVKDVLRFAPKDPPRTYQEEMVKSGGFTETDIFRLFGEHLQHTFPSQYMSMQAFEIYLKRIGFVEAISPQEPNIQALFRAFAFNEQPFLSFLELLLGFCAMENNTPHGGHTGELRSSYIFRYYCSDKAMTAEDTKTLATHIIRGRKEPAPDNAKLDAEVKNIFTATTGGADLKRTIDIKAFVKSIGERKLRGTAPLFRAQTSPLQIVRLKRAYESLTKTQIQTSTGDNRLRGIRGTCQKCKMKKYTLARHTVRLSKDGLIVDPQENKGQSDVDRMDRAQKRMSDKCFLGSTFANQLLDDLREFAYTSVPNVTRPANRDRNASNKWSAKNSRKELAEKVIKELLPACEKIFKVEPRLIHVSSPTFVLGDLHGNLHDLMIYENSLWKMGPTCVAPNFLFLGDYVDRGDYGIEVILYLLCHKVLCPDKYLLLRGNHELRNVQLGFTFKTECLEKLGPKTGEQLWQGLNNVFDLMPVCAVIDESIFCAHGGIPTHTNRVEELYKIPSPLSTPEDQCPIAWEVLWNDPVGPQEFASYAEMAKNTNQIQPPQGFLANAKRGTAFYFSEEALNRFLSVNRLSHVIRAHEVIPNGYQYHMGGRCITVFSSSRYCGGLNEAAVVLVNDDKIRVIKIETN